MRIKEKLMDIFPLVIILLFIGGLFMIGTNQLNKEIQIEDLKEITNIYGCDSPAVKYNCNTLSKINAQGISTRCYIYGEELSYRVCRTGWELK